MFIPIVSFKFSCESSSAIRFGDILDTLSVACTVVLCDT